MLFFPPSPHRDLTCHLFLGCFHIEAFEKKKNLLFSAVGSLKRSHFRSPPTATPTLRPHTWYSVSRSLSLAHRSPSLDWSGWPMTPEVSISWPTQMKRVFCGPRLLLLLRIPLCQTDRLTNHGALRRLLGTSKPKWLWNRFWVRPADTEPGNDRRGFLSLTF